MSELQVPEKIKTTLLKIVGHEDKPNIIFAEIDTGSSDQKGEGIVPFLNIYGNHLLPEEHFNEAVQTAIERDDYGYIIDVLDVVAWDDFEIKLTSLYPDWPNERTQGDLKIVATLKEAMHENSTSFEHVTVLYFHYVDNFDFVKIIDKG